MVSVPGMVVMSVLMMRSTKFDFDFAGTGVTGQVVF